MENNVLRCKNFYDRISEEYSMSKIRKRKLQVLSTIGFFLVGNIPFTIAFANDTSGNTTNKQRVEAKQLLESQDLLKNSSSTVPSNDQVVSSSENSEDTKSQEAQNVTGQTVSSTEETEKSTGHASSEKINQTTTSSEKTEETTNNKVEQDSNQSVEKATFSIADWNYKDNVDGTATLESYKGTSTDIVVPNQIDGKQTKIDLSNGINLSGGLNFQNVTSVVFSDDGNRKVQVNSFNINFATWKGLANFDGRGLDTRQVRSMSSMFSGCSSLTNINISNWDTSQVAYMSDMFKNCSSLTNINISNWDTSQVTNMARMFNDMYGLTTLDVSSWNTGAVENMNGMFAGCMKLPTLEVSSWDTGTVQNMYGMFNMMTSLTSLDLSGWKTDKVTDMTGMFLGNRVLESLNLNNWNTNNVTKLNSMFASTGLNYIDLSSFQIKPGANITGMFRMSTNTPLIIKVAPTEDRLINYDFKADNRFVGGPVFDADGGEFEDGTSLKNYFDSCAVKADDSKWKIATFKQFKNDLTATKTGYVLGGWSLLSGEEPGNEQALSKVINYTAIWNTGIIDGNIPSVEDNTKPPSTPTTYGIAYLPKQFAVNPSALNDYGAQTIPVSKKNSFHVAVRDQLLTENSWSLQAQLIWKNKSIPGSSILTTNSTGEVKKNMNDGSAPFQESDLIPISNDEVTGEKDIEITSAATVIMKAKSQKHNAVYDYNLGDVTLKIANAKIVEPDSYTGCGEWNLVDAP